MSAPHFTSFSLFFSWSNVQWSIFTVVVFGSCKRFTLIYSFKVLCHTLIVIRPSVQIWDHNSSSVQQHCQSWSDAFSPTIISCRTFPFAWKAPNCQRQMAAPNTVTFGKPHTLAAQMRIPSRMCSLVGGSESHHWLAHNFLVSECSNGGISWKVLFLQTHPQFNWGTTQEGGGTFVVSKNENELDFQNCCQETYLKVLIDSNIPMLNAARF